MFLWQYWVCSRLIKDAEKYPMIFQHSSALRDLWDRAAPLFSATRRVLFLKMAPKSWPVQWGTFFFQFRMDKALDKVLKVFWSHSIPLESTNLVRALKHGWSRSDSIVQMTTAVLVAPEVAHGAACQQPGMGDLDRNVIISGIFCHQDGTFRSNFKG